MPRRAVARIVDTVYNVTILFVCGAPSWQTVQAINAFVDHGPDVVTLDYLRTVRGVTICGEYPRIAIWAWASGDPVEDIATIAHECAHASMHVLRRAGVSATDDSDEAAAYHLEFLVRHCVASVWTGRGHRLRR